MANESRTPTRSNEEKVVLDRSTLERVLARAAELQATSHVGDIGESLNEDQLIEIGKEVGLAPAILSQALAEERTRIVVPESGGLVSHIAGPAVATAARTVQGRTEEVLQELDDWMRRAECLQVQRRFRERIVWEPMRGFLGIVRRGLNVSGRGYSLCRADSVGATVSELDNQRVIVRLDADMAEGRANRLKASGVAGVAGILGGGALFGVTSIAHVALIASAGLAIVPIAVGTYGAYHIARRHRGLFARVQLALEQALDRVEHSGKRRLK